MVKLSGGIFEDEPAGSRNVAKVETPVGGASSRNDSSPYGSATVQSLSATATGRPPVQAIILSRAYMDQNVLRCSSF